MFFVGVEIFPRTFCRRHYLQAMTHQLSRCGIFPLKSDQPRFQCFRMQLYHKNCKDGACGHTGYTYSAAFDSKAAHLLHA